MRVCTFIASTACTSPLTDSVINRFGCRDVDCDTGQISATVEVFSPVTNVAKKKKSLQKTSAVTSPLALHFLVTDKHCHLLPNKSNGFAQNSQDTIISFWHYNALFSSCYLWNLVLCVYWGTSVIFVGCISSAVYVLSRMSNVKCHWCILFYITSM